jgi:hypothetical protein
VRFRFREGQRDPLCASGQNFSARVLRAGDRLPISSSALQASSLPLRVASAWSEVDGSVWLETERGHRAPKILEQTMRQSDGFLTSLLFIASEDIETEEDDEIEKSWAVGFRRR